LSALYTANHGTLLNVVQRGIAPPYSEGHGVALLTLLRHCEAHGLPWQDPAWYGDGWTPLHAAACANHTGIATTLLTLAAEATLAGEAAPAPATDIDSGLASPQPPPPIVSAPNRYGATALHIAAVLGSASLTTVLLDAGAPHGARDGNGARPIDIAAREGHEDVLRLLRGVQVVGEDEAEEKPKGRRRGRKTKGSGGGQGSGAGAAPAAPATALP
jgi:hypothetical protein